MRRPARPKRRCGRDDPRCGSPSRRCRTAAPSRRRCHRFAPDDLAIAELTVDNARATGFRARRGHADWRAPCRSRASRGTSLRGSRRANRDRRGSHRRDGRRRSALRLRASPMRETPRQRMPATLEPALCRSPLPFLHPSLCPTASLARNKNLGICPLLSTRFRPGSFCAQQPRWYGSLTDFARNGRQVKPFFSTRRTDQRKFRAALLPHRTAGRPSRDPARHKTNTSRGRKAMTQKFMPIEMHAGARRKFLQRLGALTVTAGMSESLLAAAADRIALPFANGERSLAAYPEKRPLIVLTAAAAARNAVRGLQRRPRSRRTTHSSCAITTPASRPRSTATARIKVERQGRRAVRADDGRPEAAWPSRSRSSRSTSARATAAASSRRASPAASSPTARWATRAGAACR